MSDDSSSSDQSPSPPTDLDLDPSTEWMEIWVPELHRWSGERWNQKHVLIPFSHCRHGPDLPGPWLGRSTLRPMFLRHRLLC